MEYRSPTKLEAAIFDWAGTVVDFGSFAPTQVFVETFKEFGISITLEEARGPMGVSKWNHIRSLCDEAGIAKQYEAKFGHLPTDDDVTDIYNRFMPLQLEKIAEYSQLIPGVLETVKFLRSNDMKLGSCSGYPANVMKKVVELAKDEGLEFDCVVAGDQVPNGRPLPAQALANVVQLSIKDVSACVKVDDTTPGILEGRAAGMWTVALLCSGNSMGLTYENFISASDEEIEMRKVRVKKDFAASQPHYMIDTVADLPEVIKDINRKLARGEKP